MRRRSTAGVIRRGGTGNSTLGTGGRKKKKRRRKNRRRRSAPVIDPIRQANYIAREMTDRGDMERPVSAMTMRQVNLKWKGILSKLKTRSLRSELEGLRNEHERKCHLRDQKSEELMKEVESVNEQNLKVQKSHEEQLTSLTNFHKKRLAILEDEFKREMSSVIDEYETELHEIEISGQNTMDELDDVISTMDHRHDTETEQLRNQGDMDLYFVQKRYHQDIYVMKKALKERAEDIQEIMDRETEVNGGRVKRIYKTYMRLREEYESLLSKNRSDRVRVQRTTNQLNFWKAKWLHHVRESQIRNDRLNGEVTSIRASFRRLKRRMEKFQQNETKKLTNLVKVSNLCDRKLRVKMELGESVMQAQRLVEKLETEKERIVGMGGRMGDAEELMEEEDNIMMEKADGSFLKALMKGEKDSMNIGDEFESVNDETKCREIKTQVRAMENFFKKMNKVKMDNSSLEVENDRLSEENKKLKRMLRKYLDGISVNEKVLKSKNNPLVIVQQCSIGFNVENVAQGMKHR